MNLYGVVCFISSYVAIVISYSYNDDFNEDLLIKPLASGHVYTFFKFTITRDVDESDQYLFSHYRLFPRPMGEIISKHSVQELHLSLTQGLWRYEKWGYPYRDAPPGGELWAWFKKETKEVESIWRSLVNVLSGQFCASLNFIDETNTVTPKWSFRPEGAIVVDEGYNSTFSRYASLPREIVCTENLTPFKKLLPCDTKAGLATLLNAVNLFAAPYVSLTVDYKTICKDKRCSTTAIELVHSVSIVFDQPVSQQGKQDWSFVKMFGSGLMNTCPVATSSKVYVDTNINKTSVPFVLTPPLFDEFVSKEIGQFAVFDMKNLFESVRQINVAASYKKNHIYWLTHPPVLYASRFITGYGQENGGIHCTVYNAHPKKPLKVIYMDVIPWFLRVYTHTLTIKHGKRTIRPEYLHYRPAKDRKRPHHLEIVFTLPPKSTTEINIDFDYAFLKWTEYPPDANHGFYVGSAVMSALVDSSQNFTHLPEEIISKGEPNFFLRLHTQILLVSLPTPDFSMPYNVICFVCTVVALAFGPIHNITTKSLSPVESKKEEGFFARIKKKIKNWWKKEKEDTNEEMKKTK